MTAFGSVRRTFRLAAAATLVASLSAGPARAQMAEDPDPAGRIDVSVAVGLLTPLSNLTENTSSFGTVIDPYVSFGADATLWTSRRFGVGLTGVFAPSQLSAIGTQFQGAIPSDLGDATYLAAALNAVYRFPVSGSAAVIEPYVAGGAGIRYLSVDAIAGPEVDSTTDPAATLALGVRVGVLQGLILHFEARDFASIFESPASGDSKLQNDFVVTVGVGTRVR